MTMKTRASTRRSTSRENVPVPGLTCLPEIQPPIFPEFPTFQELVKQHEESSSETVSRRLSDLFDGTLGDQTRLVEDFQKYPEKYGEECRELLQRLESGSASVKHLNPNDRRLLNLATLDYHQSVPPKKSPTPENSTAKESRPVQRVQRVKRQKPPIERPRPGLDVPVTELPVYWWLS